MTGYINIWTSVHGVMNLIRGVECFGQNKESSLYNIQISVPTSAIMTMEVKNDSTVEFFCHRKELW